MALKTDLFCLQVVSMDTETNTVSFHDGTSQHYSQVLIATGARSLPFLCAFSVFSVFPQSLIDNGYDCVEQGVCNVLVLKWRM